MLRLSKKTDYALMAMKHLALQSAASGGMGAASAREIAEHYDIPIELLAKILQRLARRGLLTSHQGTRGGYSLARPATVISVADVIQAVDGPLTVTACSVHDQGCGQYSKCNVRDPLWRIKDRILTSLAACSLDEIATDVPMTSAGPELQPVTSLAPRARVNPLYFDGHATTPCDPRVVTAMLPYFTERFGNASSAQHPFGWAAREAVEHARGQVASLIGARPRDVVFTSGATESNNLAIAGAVRALRSRGRHVVTLATEHTAVLDVCAALEADGAIEVTRLGVDAGGLVDPAAVDAALRADTVLVSVMAANNEIGVLQPIAAIGALVRARGVAFHVDAAQAAGKVALDVEAIGADLLSISAHKFYGPKGVGALYVRRRGPVADLPPLHHGGGHERGLRSGTLNVPGIVGCGAAAEIARASMADDAATLGALRDRLLEGLQARVDGLHLNGARTPRLPHNLNVRIDRVSGRELLMGLSDVSLSSGAACCTASAEPSHVLKAIGLSDEAARASLRFGLIRGTTAEDVDAAIDAVAGVVAALRR